MKFKTIFSLLMTIAVPVAGISFAPTYAEKEVTWTYAEGEHTHNGKTFTAWTSSDSLPDTSGNWYLTDDVSIASTWVPQSGTHLCLNGHGIRLTTGEGSVVNIDVGRSVFIYDCALSGEQTHKYCIDETGLAKVDDSLTEPYETFTGGYITGGKGNNGSGIFLNAIKSDVYEIVTSLEMYGGTIIGNHTTTDGGGIAFRWADRNRGNIQLQDTSIIGNVADGKAGGIFHEASNPYPMEFSGKTVIFKNASGVAPAGVLEEHRLRLKGEVHIEDNHLKDGTPSDLKVWHDWNKGQDQALALNGDLDPNSHIGIDALRHEQIENFAQYCSVNPNSVLESNNGDIYGIKDGKVIYNEPNEDFEFVTGEPQPSGTPTIDLPDSSSIESITYGLVEGTYDRLEPPTFKGFGDFHFFYKIVAGRNTRYGRIDVHIVKADPEVTLEPAAVPSLLYTGEAQALLTAGTADGGTLQYRIGTTGEWSNDLPTATDVGTYDVYYRVKGDASHNDSKTETKIQVTISANDKTDLTTAITDAQTYLNTVKGTYGDAIVAGYQSAIAAANLVSGDDNKTVTEINDAITSLADAKNTLDGKLGEIDGVKAAINALPAEVTLESESDIVAAGAAYEALDDAQKAAIDSATKTKLTDAEEALDVLKAGQVTSLINAIGEPVTLGSEDAINAARAAYDALTEQGKSFIDNVTLQKLLDAEADLAKIKDDKTTLSTAISDAQTYLATVEGTYGDAIVADYQGAIDAAILVRDDNSKTAAEINDATASLASAKNTLDGKLGEIDGVKAAINALPAEVTLESESAIVAAKTAYEALDDAQKAAIDSATLAKLTDAQEDLAEIKDGKANLSTAISDAQTYLATVEGTYGQAIVADYQSAIDAAILVRDDNNKTATEINDAIASLTSAKNTLDGKLGEIDGVKAAINALPAEVTLESESAIVAARDAYEALTPAQKEGVSAEIYAKLVAEENALTQLKKDIADAERVTSMIDAIGEVTLGKEGAITSAREAYDALTEQGKSFVDNDTLQKLLDAEVTLAALKADQAAVDNAKALINSIGEVTLESEDKIAAARAAYDALTQDLKDRVGSHLAVILSNAENTLRTLKANKAAIDGYKNLVEQIGEVEDSEAFASRVAAAKAAYDALTDEQKQAVEAEYRVMTQKEQAYNKIVNDKKTTKTLTIAGIAAGGVVVLLLLIYSFMFLFGRKFVVDPRKEKVLRVVPTRKKAGIATLLTMKLRTIHYSEADLYKRKKDAKAALEANKKQREEALNAIRAIGEVTLEKEQKIHAARDAFDALSDQQKAKIPTEDLNALEEAEETFAALEAEDAAREVEALISQIGKEPLEHEAAIIDARKAYDGLDENERSYFSAYSLNKLEKAEEALRIAKSKAEEKEGKEPEKKEPKKAKKGNKDGEGAE